HDPAEQVDRVGGGVALQLQEHAERDVEDDELHRRLHVAPQHAQRAAAVAHPQLLAHQQPQQEALPDRVQPARVLSGGAPALGLLRAGGKPHRASGTAGHHAALPPSAVPCARSCSRTGAGFSAKVLSQASKEVIREDAYRYRSRSVFQPRCSATWAEIASPSIPRTFCGSRLYQETWVPSALDTSALS